MKKNMTKPSCTSGCDTLYLQASKSLVVNADGGHEVEALLPVAVVVGLDGVVVGLHLVADHPHDLPVGRRSDHRADDLARIRTL